MVKVVNAYEVISKYHSYLHPDKPHTKMEESWIWIVHNMAEQILASRTIYETAEQSHLKHIKERSEEYNIEYNTNS
jgi:hypothetical protein